MLEWVQKKVWRAQWKCSGAVWALRLLMKGEPWSTKIAPAMESRYVEAMWMSLLYWQKWYLLEESSVVEYGVASYGGVDGLWASLSALEKSLLIKIWLGGLAEAAKSESVEAPFFLSDWEAMSAWEKAWLDDYCFADEGTAPSGSEEAAEAALELEAMALVAGVEQSLREAAAGSSGWEAELRAAAEAEAEEE